jgi:mono/diheme cytochrome c family protein
VRIWLALCVTSFLLVGCVERPAEDASGEEIYVQLCSNCHDTDLSGAVGPPIGPGSNAASQPDEFLRVTITNGRGRMPSFRSNLDAEQIDRLISFIREEQGG